MTLQIEWIDHGREPVAKPNPAYPLGFDADLSEGATKTCAASLPYPARRCGLYFVRCAECGQQIVITTAGRPDDPRSVKVACKARLQ